MDSIQINRGKDLMAIGSVRFTAAILDLNKRVQEEWARRNIERLGKKRAEILDYFIRYIKEKYQIRDDVYLEIASHSSSPEQEILLIDGQHAASLYTIISGNEMEFNLEFNQEFKLGEKDE
jgi:hypothetical protein